jgi:Tol biopolymer transport system component
MSIQNRNSDIYVMDADGSHVTRLTTDPAEDTTPTWRQLVRLKFTAESD